jgi:hypothetical protein
LVNQVTKLKRTPEKYRGKQKYFMSYLDTIISRVSNYTAKATSRVRLGDFLEDATHEDAATRIREMSDKADRDFAKAQLPAALISCRTDNRDAGTPFEHTGLICVDIDAKHNPGVTDWGRFIACELPKLDVITYAGPSVSGRGCFAIIPIANSGHHVGHFEAIREDFKRCGVTLDIAGKNPRNLRGYSYSNEIGSFHNPNAKTYTRILNPPPAKTVQMPTGADARKVQEAVNRIVAEKRDVTNGYESWIKIAQALAVTFGEGGREWFHLVSQFNPEYDYQQADSKYTSFLGRGYNQVGLGTFFRQCAID